MPELYVKMEQEWEHEWEWRCKEEYVEPGEAEGPEWWEPYERPPTQEEAMQAGPMQARPMQAAPMQAEGRATLCSMFCMSPYCDFGHFSRGVGRVFHVIRVPFLCFRSRLWEQLHCPARFWRPLYRAPADRDRSITPVEHRRSPINVKTEEAEEESANENVMLEVGVRSSFVAVHVPRVASLCLQPCF